MVTYNDTHGSDSKDVIKGFDLEKTDLSKTLQSTLASRFAGMEVDASTKTFLDFLLYQFMPHAAEKVEKHGVKFLKDTALSTGLMKSETAALNFGKEHAPKLAVATVLAEPILSLGVSAYDTTTRVNDLRKALTPIAKGNNKYASVEAIFGSNNEVVQNARSKIYSQLYADVGGVVARSIVALPALITVRNRAKERAKLQENEVDLELAIKDPEARKKYIQDQIKGGSSIHSSVEEEKDKHLKQERTTYQKEFEAWESGTEGKKASEEILKRLKTDDDYAKKLGVDQILKRQIEVTKNGNKTQTTVKDGLANKYRDNRSIFKNEGSEIERVVKKQLRYRFVDDVKNGKAFDHTWIEQKMDRFGRPYADEKRSGPRTIEESIEGFYKDMADKLSGKKAAAENELKAHKGDGKGPDIFNQGIMGLASLAGNKLDQLLVGDKRKDLSKPIAMELIMHLKKTHDENPEAESVANYGSKSGDSSFVKFVHDIFQQHQVDCHKSEVGDRYFDKIKHANFKDEAIFQMRDEDLGAYEVAIKHIARAIKEGQMDAVALINLVGQRKIVQKDGKHFGPKGSDGKAEGVLDEINKQCACIASHKGLTAEQLSELMAKFVFTEEELKAGFAVGGTFAGEEKSFMFALLESQVKDAGTMKKITGLTEDEMDHLRKTSRSHFTRHFDAAITTIAEMSNDELADLVKYEITPDEIKLIRNAASGMKSSGKHAEDLATGEAKEHLEAAVANVVMAEQKEDAPKWRDRVQKRIKDSIASALEQPTAIESKLAEIKQERGGFTSAQDRLRDEREMESHNHRLAP